MKRLLFVIYFLSTSGVAQLPPEQEKQIDSLKLLIYNAPNDTVIINAWQAWDNIIYAYDPLLDFQLNSKIDSLCSLNLKKNLGKKERRKFLNARGGALNILGIIYKSQGEFDVALNYLKQSLEIRKELGNKSGITEALNNLGVIYFDQGEFAEAIDHYTRSLKISEEISDQPMVAKTLNNIGNIHAAQENLEKAIEYHLRSLEIGESLNNVAIIAPSFNNLGNAYKQLNELKKAVEYYEKALEIHKQHDDKYGTQGILMNIGAIHQTHGEFDLAIDCFSQSLVINEELGDKHGISMALQNLGNTYQLKGNLNKSVKYSLEALKVAQEIGALPRIREASAALWVAYKGQGQFKNSLEMYELFIRSRDSIASVENQKEVIRQEYKYQYEKQAVADSIKVAEAAKVKDAELAAERAESKRLELEGKQKERQKYYLSGILALALIFGGVIYSRYRLTNKQKGIIEEQKIKVDRAYEQLEEKNTEILDSINYAKRIQSAILPPNKLVKEYLKDSFVLYKPKDIVAGDFYWMEPHENGVLFAAADCTGHGVPGAMVSVLCNNGLNRSVREHGLKEPGQILDKTREIVISEFEKSEEEVKDGMDIALCSLEGNMLKYAGAHNPLWIIRSGAEDVEEIKADKQPIGKYDEPTPYETHTIELNPGDTFYTFSDGYADQFGGDKGKKLKAKNFKNLLLSIQKEPMERQRELIDEAFETWKGDFEQLDDVCVIGVRV